MKYETTKTFLSWIIDIALVGIVVSIWITKWSDATKMFLTSMFLLVTAFALYVVVLKIKPNRKVKKMKTEKEIKERINMLEEVYKDFNKEVILESAINNLKWVLK